MCVTSAKVNLSLCGFLQEEDLSRGLQQPKRHLSWNHNNNLRVNWPIASSTKNTQVNIIHKLFLDAQRLFVRRSLSLPGDGWAISYEETFVIRAIEEARGHMLSSPVDIICWF